eukprot:g3701.t1
MAAPEQGRRATDPLIAPPSDCCPTGSAPSLDTSDYAEKGSTIRCDGISVYVSEPPAGSPPPKGKILVFHDIFGNRSGRTREICDELAAEGPYLVWAPDFFMGSSPLDARDDPNNKGSSKCGLFCRMFCCCKLCKCVGGLKKHNWKRVRGMLTDSILPALDKQQASGSGGGSGDGGGAGGGGAGADDNNHSGPLPIGLLGFCWGGWAATRAASERRAGGGDPTFACAIGCHPSLKVCQAVGESKQVACDMVQCPLMYLSASNDEAECKEGGMMETSLQARGIDCHIETFGSQQHGWVNRGTAHFPGDTEVTAEAARALGLVKGFFAKHLQQRGGGGAGEGGEGKRA